jgi:hypothetical protein
VTRTLRGLSLACLVALVAASGEARAQEAEKLAEYGEANCETELARLDEFALPVLERRDAEAHVLVYAGRDEPSGKTRRRVRFITEYLTEARGIDAARVRVGEGGRRERAAVELFLVARGARPPLPTPTLQTTSDDDAGGARKFDEGRLGLTRDARGRATLWDGSDAMCSHAVPDLGDYARALREDAGARAHVVVYGARGARLSESNTVSRLIRYRLFNFERIAQRRITVVYGGTREEPFVELWLVPRGAPAPAASR